MYKPLKRFLTTTAAFAASITAGFAREIASAKGGHNVKERNIRKKGEKRVKKIPYGKSRWGTLGAQEYKYPASRYQQKPSVIKQFQKSEAYKAKINSKQWKKAAGERWA